MRIACLIAFSLLAACSAQNDQGNSAATVLDTEARAPIISEGAVSEMDRKDYPKMLNRLGSDGFDRANKLTQQAAELAASRPSCDALEAIGVSDRSDRTIIRWFADCQNGQRIRVEERPNGLSAYEDKIF